MPPEYRTPGVYVEEIPSGPHPIAGVSTPVTAFVGRNAASTATASTAPSTSSRREASRDSASNSCHAALIRKLPVRSV